MSPMTNTTGTFLIVHNCRLAFPDVYVAKQFEGTGPYTYKATLLVEPMSSDAKNIQDEIHRVAHAKWGVKSEGILKTLVGQSQKYCFIDGNTKAYAGFANMMALSASRRQDAGPPKVVNQQKQDLTAESGKPYSGCLVHAKVSLWAQDNQFGKGIRCTLLGLQFAGDGDAFSGGGSANGDGFEEIVEVYADLM